jgi:hypothetical protein
MFNAKDEVKITEERLEYCKLRLANAIAWLIKTDGPHLNKIFRLSIKKWSRQIKMYETQLTNEKEKRCVPHKSRKR